MNIKSFRHCWQMPGVVNQLVCRLQFGWVSTYFFFLLFLYSLLTNCSTRAHTIYAKCCCAECKINEQQWKAHSMSRSCRMCYPHILNDPIYQTHFWLHSLVVFFFSVSLLSCVAVARSGFQQVCNWIKRIA